MEHEPIEYGARFSGAALEDLRQVQDQALRLADRYAARPDLRGIFDVVAMIALVNRARPDPRITHTGAVVMTDETTPLTQQIDDVGTAMAHVMALWESEETSPGAKRIWLELLNSMATDVRRRRAAR